MEKKALNKKRLKIVLIVCIVVALTAGIGLAAYTYHVDTTTLGRRISIYGLDVSKFTAEEARKKITETFQDSTVNFKEDGENVYNVSMAQLGYSLDQDVLKSTLESLKQQRRQNRQIFAAQKDYKIDYQIIKDEAQEQSALSADNFGSKEKKGNTGNKDCHVYC